MADDRERETLDQLQERFGDLRDRFEQSTVPGMRQESLPTAEHPRSVAVREEAAQDSKPSHDIWPNEAVRPDFEQAASGVQDDAQEGQGVSSRQVGEDAPEHNLPAPRDSEDEDRATHADRMARDDTEARRTLPEDYYDRLAERMREADLERQAYGQEQGYDQDYDRSR